MVLAQSGLMVQPAQAVGPAQRYASGPMADFTVDGYVGRIVALLADERFAAAAEISAKAAPLADSVVDKLQTYYEVRGVNSSHPEYYDYSRRDLEWVNRLVAGHIAAVPFGEFDDRFLRQLVMVAGMQSTIPDGFGLLFTYGVHASYEHLSGTAQALYEAFCYQAVAYFRNVGCGAYMASHAYELAAEAQRRLEIGVKRLDDTYGPRTKQRSLRDMSTMFSMSTDTLATPCRLEAKVRFLDYIFDNVARYVPKYTETTWTPFFRHQWEACVRELPQAYVPLAHDLFLTLQSSGKRFREGTKLYERAHDIAYDGSFVCQGGTRDSTSDMAIAGHLTLMFEDAIKRVAVLHALGVTPEESQLAEFWLKQQYRRLPRPDAEQMAAWTPAFVTYVQREMRTGWNARLDGLFDELVGASQRFAEIRRANRRMAGAVQQVIKTVAGKARLSDPAGTERRLLAFTNKCMELSCYGSYQHMCDRLWTWQRYELAPGDADPTEVQAQLYQLLPKAFERAGAGQDSQHLIAFLSAMGAAAAALPAARMLGDGSTAERLAAQAIQLANIADRKIPTFELVALYKQVGHAMLCGADELAIARLTRYVADFCVLHHRPATPVPYQLRMLQAMTKSAEAQIDPAQRPLLMQVMGQLAEFAPYLVSALPVAHAARQIAEQSITQFVADKEKWHSFELDGKQEQSTYDVEIVLRAASQFMLRPGPKMLGAINEWLQLAVMGFLPPGAFKSIPTLLKHLRQAAQHQLPPGMAETLIPVLERAYGKSAEA